MKKRHESLRLIGAFTLLEVMVAIALLALGLSTLFLAQARSLELAQQARNLSVATGLARMQLHECEFDFRQKQGFASIGDYKENGNFSDDDYPNFFWECYAYKPDIPVADGGDISEGILGKMSADAEAAGGAENPMASMGVGLISPVLAQVSQVVGDSVRELYVVVRWKEGEEWTELDVTTHIIDMAAMQGVAQQIRGAAAAMGGGIPGLGGASGASGTGGTGAINSGSVPVPGAGGALK